MSTSKPLQLYLAGIAALIFSMKVKAKCDWCSIALVAVFLVLFIIASVLVYRKNKKIKRLKDKDLL